MYRCLIPLTITVLLLSFCGLAGAQFPFWIGPPNPFFFSRPYGGQFTMFPPLLPLGPFYPPGFALSTTFPQISPPVPMIRQARATLTILFNPTQSIIQVTVLPISPTVAAAPVAVPPTAVAPAVAPSALLLLPLLSGLGGTTPQTQVNTIGSVPPVTPVTSAPTGLSSLLPLI